MRHWALHLSLVLLLLGAKSVAAQGAPAAQPGAEALQRANAAFMSSDWKAALEAYSALSAQYPAHALSRFRMGVSLVGLGRFAEGETRLREGERLGIGAGQAGVRLAQALSEQGKVDAAVAELMRAAGAGLAVARAQLDTIAHLSAARASSRWPAVLEAFDTVTRPCMHDARFREFDFWVGDWDVRATGTPAVGPAARNTVTLDDDGCVVTEHWVAPGGSTGQSFNIFDRSIGRWRQTWVDNSGGQHDYRGGLEGGNMVYAGDTPAPNGQLGRIPTRLTFFHLGPDSVRQYSETSADGGKSWRVAYDLMYVRRRVPPAQPTADPPNPADFGNYKTVKVADGVYAFIAPDGITPVVSGNTMVVIGDDGVLIVDTGQFPSVARQEIAAIRRLTPLPVRYIVNTHWHPDHWLGNGAFKAAFPDVKIISTPNTADLMASKAQPFIGAKYVADVQAFLKEYMASPEKRDEAELRYYRYGQMQFATFGAELASANPTLPDTRFDSALTLRLGRREVQVRFMGRGNTGGDAVVYVPDVNVVATGDLLVHPYPYGIGSFIGEWIGTLGRVAAMGATSIVPGHGGVQHDTVYLGRVVRLLASVRRQAAESAQQGRSLDETRARMDLAGAEREFCGDSSWCRYVFKGNFVRPAVERAYREAKEGALKDER
jgi:cyclase